ncbi:hypothetical protein [Aeromonas veronii]|uniref:hypothetical protein n=1 Tax=Aeromonas veronii TaxID=654 RepID=UPI002443EB84|nr:hypothetical protein [Aeromonas veronii]
MKAIRIILQLVILAAGGITLAALIAVPTPNFTVIVVLLGFVALLLALTQALKEHTKNRLSPDHKLSFKPIGMVLLLSGMFAMVSTARAFSSDSNPYRMVVVHAVPCAGSYCWHPKHLAKQLPNCLPSACGQSRDYFFALLVTTW